MSGGFGAGLPLRVVASSREQVVAFLREGTEVAAPVLADGRELRDVPLAERWDFPRRSVRRPWRETDVVIIFPRGGRRYSLWVFHAQGQHLGWYVNLEAPHVFGERTISTDDGVLDVWVPADTGEPEWKDEDEFAVAVKVGRIPGAKARALRAEGERVISERPWPTGWENWEPPDNWARPELPENWAVTR
jgi:hypothetical protein